MGVLSNMPYMETAPYTAHLSPRCLCQTSLVKKPFPLNLNLEEAGEKGSIGSYQLPSGDR